MFAANGLSKMYIAQGASRPSCRGGVVESVAVFACFFFFGGRIGEVGIPTFV